MKVSRCKRMFMTAICLVAISPKKMHAFIAQEKADILAGEKYLQGGQLEKVSFYAMKDPDSIQKFARNGILLKRPGAQANVIICHGYMCDKFDASFLRTLFPKYNVLMFDFRAHGEGVHDEHYCTFGRDEAYDVMAAVQYIKQREDIGALPRIGYGFSMGAVASIQAQAEDPTLFEAMVLDCPYDTSENIINRGLDKVKITLFGYTFDLPCKWLLQRYAFHPYVQTLLKATLKTVAKMDALCTNTQIFPVSPLESIKKITVPCFFVHCAHDEKIPVQSIENVYNNAPGFKRLWVTDGRRHFDSFFYNPEQYTYKINRFIDKALNKSCESKIQAKKMYDVATGAPGCATSADRKQNT